MGSLGETSRQLEDLTVRFLTKYLEEEAAQKQQEVTAAGGNSSQGADDQGSDRRSFARLMSSYKTASGSMDAFSLLTQSSNSSLGFMTDDSLDSLGSNGYHSSRFSYANVPVIMRNRLKEVNQSHKLRLKDIKGEVFDWIYTHLEQRKCPYSLSVALATKVSLELTHQIEDYIQEKYCSYSDSSPIKKQRVEEGEENPDLPSPSQVHSKNTPKKSFVLSFIPQDPNCNPLSFVADSSDVRKESLRILSIISSELLKTSSGIGNNCSPSLSCVSSGRDCTDSSDSFSAQPESLSPAHLAVADIIVADHCLSHPSRLPFPVTSVASARNCRKTMEDRHVVIHDLNTVCGLTDSVKQYAYYAVFDGHAGVDAATFAASHLHHNLVSMQSFKDGNIEDALKTAFGATDSEYLERSALTKVKSGCTAVVCLKESIVSKETTHSKLFFAWAGDSQAILIRGGSPIDITPPHKPEDENERNRIVAAGGSVENIDIWRVDGTLAVSRAIGDPDYKPHVTSEPEVVSVDVQSQDDFVILACDGLWDQISPEEATSLVYEHLATESQTKAEQEEGSVISLEEVAQNVSNVLMDAAKREGSQDNITVVVVFLKDIKSMLATSSATPTKSTMKTSNPHVSTSKVADDTSVDASEALEAIEQTYSFLDSSTFVTGNGSAVKESSSFGVNGSTAEEGDSTSFVTANGSAVGANGSAVGAKEASSLGVNESFAGDTNKSSGITDFTDPSFYSCYTDSPERPEDKEEHDRTTSTEVSTATLFATSMDQSFMIESPGEKGVVLHSTPSNFPVPSEEETNFYSFSQTQLDQEENFANKNNNQALSFGVRLDSDEEEDNISRDDESTPSPNPQLLPREYDTQKDETKDKLQSGIQESSMDSKNGSLLHHESSSLPLSTPSLNEVQDDHLNYFGSQNLVVVSDEETDKIQEPVKPVEQTKFDDELISLEAVTFDGKKRDEGCDEKSISSPKSHQLLQMDDEKHFSYDEESNPEGNNANSCLTQKQETQDTHFEQCSVQLESESVGEENDNDTRVKESHTSSKSNQELQNETDEREVEEDVIVTKEELLPEKQLYEKQESMEVLHHPSPPPLSSPPLSPSSINGREDDANQFVSQNVLASDFEKEEARAESAVSSVSLVNLEPQVDDGSFIPSLNDSVGRKSTSDEKLLVSPNIQIQSQTNDDKLHSPPALTSSEQDKVFDEPSVLSLDKDLLYNESMIMQDESGSKNEKKDNAQDTLVTIQEPQRNGDKQSSSGVEETYDEKEYKMQDYNSSPSLIREKRSDFEDICVAAETSEAFDFVEDKNTKEVQDVNSFISEQQQEPETTEQGHETEAVTAVEEENKTREKEPVASFKDLSPKNETNKKQEDVTSFNKKSSLTKSAATAVQAVAGKTIASSGEKKGLTSRSPTRKPVTSTTNTAAVTSNTTTTRPTSASRSVSAARSVPVTKTNTAASTVTSTTRLRTNVAPTTSSAPKVNGVSKKTDVPAASSVKPTSPEKKVTKVSGISSRLYPEPTARSVSASRSTTTASVSTSRLKTNVPLTKASAPKVNGILKKTDTSATSSAINSNANGEKKIPRVTGVSSRLYPGPKAKPAEASETSSSRPESTVRSKATLAPSLKVTTVRATTSSLSRPTVSSRTTTSSSNLRTSKQPASKRETSRTRETAIRVPNSIEIKSASGASALFGIVPGPLIPVSSRGCSPAPVTPVTPASDAPLSSPVPSSLADV